MQKIKIFLVDDHEIVLEGMKIFLEHTKEFEIIGTARSISSMFERLENKSVDVLVLDFKLPDGDGVNASFKLKLLYPKLKILLVTAFTNKEMIQSALNSEIDGIAFKTTDADTLISTIQSLYNGNYVLEDSIPKAIYCNDNVRANIDFTNKELKLFELISLGRTNHEIAEQLNLTEKTIRNYLYTLYRKINVNNRTEAAHYWMNYRICNKDK